MTPALINGVNYSWIDIKFVLFGIPVTGITKITYNEKQEKTNNYGAGEKPISRGYGRKTYEGSIEIYTDVLKKIIDAAPNRSFLDIPPSDIQVIFGSSRTLFDKDVLRQVEFLENPFDVSEGDTSIKVTIPLIIADITR